MKCVFFFQSRNLIHSRFDWQQTNENRFEFMKLENGKHHRSANNKIHEINALHRYLLANYFVQFVNIIEKDVVVSHGFGRNVICIFDFDAAVCEFLFCLTNTKKGLIFPAFVFLLYTFAPRSAARLKYRIVCVFVCWCVCVCCCLWVRVGWLVACLLAFPFGRMIRVFQVGVMCLLLLLAVAHKYVVRIVKNTDFRSSML